MRVVSLLPAATEIVAALGAGSRLVGVTHECDYPPEVRALPHVTRTRVDPSLPSREIDRAVADAKRTGVSPIEVDVALVARLRPDVIIGQAVCDVCAVGEGELARLVGDLMPTPGW
jgi:iron complex transport system substrate-binding protein